MKEKKKGKSDNFKEKIKKTFKKIILAGMISASALASSYSAVMLGIPPHDVPGYEYEMNLIRRGDKLANEGRDEDYIYYKIAIESVKRRQDKLGEGNDVNLDWMRVYTLYSAAKSPPQPERAEKYLSEAKELAKKYYEIWKDDRFIYLYIVALENLGDIYFNAAENVRKGKTAIILLKSSTTTHNGTKVSSIFVPMGNLHYYINSYEYKKIITSDNFTDILYYYERAEEYYRTYLRFYEKEKEGIIKGLIERHPKVAEYFSQLNQNACSNLKIIDKILSKYKPDYKKEEKEAVEKKEEIEKEDKKTKEKEQEKINLDEIKDKDIQDGL